MQYSVGVEYAIHSLFYMTKMPSGKNVGIKELAELNNLPESYLSKVFTKLKKNGIVKSVPGVKGGYELAKNPKEISFWDIIEAVEGDKHIFHCAEIRKQNIFVDDPNVFTPACPCLIKVVIHEAEEKMRNHLKSKSLLWLYKNVNKDFDEKKKNDIKNWINNI